MEKILGFISDKESSCKSWSEKIDSRKCQKEQLEYYLFILTAKSDIRFETISHHEICINKFKRKRETLDAPQVLSLDSNHAFGALLAAKIPAPLKPHVVQRGEHEAFGNGVWVSKPWSGAKSKDGSLPLDGYSEKFRWLGTKETSSGIGKFASDLVKNRSKIDTWMQANV